MEKEQGTKIKRIAWELVGILIASIGSAFALYVFVYPNNFAPGGVNGITTMLQYITQISAGWWAMLINISLLVIAWFILKKKYVFYVVFYTIVSSLFIVLLQKIKFYEYFAIGEGILPAAVSGIILGAMTGILLAVGGSSGGLDTVACMIQQKKPQLKIERIISIFCYIIVLCSYFVYKDVNCILLALVHIFTYEKGMGFVLSQKRNKVSVFIFTKTPEDTVKWVKEKCDKQLIFLKSEKQTLEETIAVLQVFVMKKDVSKFMEKMQDCPNAYTYYTDVGGTTGAEKEHIGETI